MKQAGFLIVCVAVILSALSSAAQDAGNELTGVYHRERLKNPAYLQIDGAGFISRIILAGEILQRLDDGARVWVKGRITTRLYGSSVRAKQDSQQGPTQWFIVFQVEECREITKPFERPSDKK